MFLFTVTIAMTNVFFRPFLFTLVFIYSAMTAWLNGWFTAIVMKFFGATDWCFAAFASAIAFPVFSVGLLITVDLIEYIKKSSAATPPIAVFLLGALWMAISIPLNFHGAFTGFKQEKN